MQSDRASVKAFARNGLVGTTQAIVIASRMYRRCAVQIIAQSSLMEVIGSVAKVFYHLLDWQMSAKQSTCLWMVIGKSSSG